MRMNDLLIDRTPPQNIEAEQAVLGAIFIEPESLTVASEFLIPGRFLSEFSSKNLFSNVKTKRPRESH